MMFTEAKNNLGLFLPSKNMWIWSLNVLLDIAVIFQSVILQRIKFCCDCRAFSVC